jgi:hypothetical protein
MQERELTIAAISHRDNPHAMDCNARATATSVSRRAPGPEQNLTTEKKFERIQCSWFQIMGRVRAVPDAEVRRLEALAHFSSDLSRDGATRVPRRHRCRFFLQVRPIIFADSPRE